MATIKITSQLRKKLQPTALTPSILEERFGFWKNNGEDSSYWFGQNKTDPKTELSHAHMAPVSTGSEKDKWNEYWAKRRPWLRRSDCYVIYVYDPVHGYLLIDVLFDPGAHKLWTPACKQSLADYETVADNFIFDGSVP